MIEKNIDVTSPRLDPVKSCGCAVVFLIQSCFSLETEQNFSKIKWFNSIFVRVRDVLVSDYLKTVYFPIPKSACTLLATMLALHDPQTRDFDPEAEGVHRYRFRKNA